MRNYISLFYMDVIYYPCPITSHCLHGCDLLSMPNYISLFTWMWFITHAQLHLTVYMDVIYHSCPITSHCLHGCDLLSMPNYISLFYMDVIYYPRPLTSHCFTWMWFIIHVQLHLTVLHGCDLLSMSNYMSLFYMDVIYYPCPITCHCFTWMWFIIHVLTLILVWLIPVSKRDPRRLPLMTVCLVITTQIGFHSPLFPPALNPISPGPGPKG